LETEDEIMLLMEDIISRKPDVVFVGMGSPRQELLMEKLAEQYPALYQGVGGSFDVYAGVLKRAPKWLIDRNLGGVYRVFSDISLNRIKRLFSDILFIIKVFFYFYK
jgi:UDP-N-acetyl-D-mannosaminouronate:lipid I N-acetyl-D-mannosaminouronosyltransferase